MKKYRETVSQTNLLNNLQSYVDSLVEEQGIPAVSLAVWHKNQLHRAAAGVLNIKTGVEATPDSIFQIGSITKVFTASLVMQLVDEGLIDLDAPVKNYLRDFHIADIEATQSITVRQLLNHSNGMAGDYFPDDSHESGNTLARYVDRIHLLPLIHSPGEMFSYSNAGYALAGRLIEVVSGIPWRQAMVDRIFEPLGLSHAVADPKETLRYRAAIGHIQNPDAPHQVGSQWTLPSACYMSLSQAPAGTTPMMTASDLITFARAHLNKGQSAVGKAWLTPASAHLMQQASVALPPCDAVFEHQRGLGWGVYTHKQSAISMIGHAGQTLGQTSMLRLLPTENSAFAVLLNGVKPGVLDGIVNKLTLVLANIDCSEPKPVTIRGNIKNLQPYTGTYDSITDRYQVALAEGNNALILFAIDKKSKVIHEFNLQSLGEHIFAVYSSYGQRQPNLMFIHHHSDAVPSHLFFGFRMNPRCCH